MSAITFSVIHSTLNKHCKLSEPEQREKTRDLIVAMSTASEDSRILLRNVIQFLGTVHHDRTIAERYCLDEMTPDEVVACELPEISPRNAIIDRLIKILQPHVSNYAELAEELEQGCYKRSIEIAKDSEDLICRKWNTRFKTIYLNRCQIVLYTVDPESDANKKYGRFVDKIISGEISAAACGEMSERDLWPDALTKEKKHIKERQEQKVELKHSNLFICPKCKGKKTTYIARQVRALDEGESYEVTCANPICLHTFMRS